MTDAHLKILRVVARGRARQLAAFDASGAGAKPPVEPERDALVRQSDRAHRELSSARRRRARQDG